MNNLTKWVRRGIVLLLLTLVFPPAQAQAQGKSKGKPKDDRRTESEPASPPVHRPYRLLATHGMSHINAPQLERLSVAEDVFVIGIGAGLLIESGMGIDLEYLGSDTVRKDRSDYGHTYSSNATTRYTHERLVVSGNWRFSLAKNFVMFPELGVSYNIITVDLREFNYKERQKSNALGRHLGVGANIPIKRVFFDFRLRYGLIDLEMEKLGVNSTVYQTTLLFGFGFTI